MKIEDLAEVRVWAPQARFAHVDKPFFVLSDFPWQWGSAMWSSIGGVVADPTMQLVHPEPIRVPVHSLSRTSVHVGNGTIPWTLESVAGRLAPFSDFYATHVTREVLVAVPADTLYWSLQPSSADRAGAGVTRWATGKADDGFIAPAVPYPTITGHVVGIDFNPYPYNPNDLPYTLFARSDPFERQGIVLEIGASIGHLAIGSGEPPSQLSIGPNPDPPDPDPDPDPDPPGGGESLSKAFIAAGVSVGLGDDERVYGVVLRANGDALIFRYDVADQEWRELRTIANAATVAIQRNQLRIAGRNGTVGSGGMTIIANPLTLAPEDVDKGQRIGESFYYQYHLRPMPIEFRLIGGRMTIRVGNNEEAYAFAEDRVDAEGEPIRILTQAHVCGIGLGNAHLSTQFVGFRSASYLDSPPVPVGFQSDLWLEPEVRTVGDVPEGWTVEVDEENSSLTGPDVRYRLKFDGPRDGSFNGTDYAWTTPAVRSVEMMWAPSGTARPAPPYLASPEGIVVSHRFDPVTLQAGSQAVITFNNNRMALLPSGVVGYWGEWSLARGQVGLEVWATRTSTATGWFGPPTLLGTFYGHTEGETAGQAGDSRFAMFCSDRRVQLRSPRWNLPWMDGWNAFYAIGFLAQLGGVAPGDWEFAHLVPDAPFGEGTDLGNGFGGRAPYLPVGDAGSVVTRFSGLPLWEVMAKIAQFLGYMLFFGSNGKLQFRPFRLAPGSRRFFAESDRESAGAEGCWALRVRKRHDTVRSDAVTIGIDAFAGKWEPIVFKHSEEAVVYDDLAFNHLGYRNPSVWVDSAFADPWFAWMASLEQMNVGRVPALSAQFTTWLQPDLLPLDVVSLRAPRFGMYDLDLMVVGVDHRVASDGPGSTTITAAYVPDPLFQV